VNGGGETAGIAAVWLIGTLCHTFHGILSFFPKCNGNRMNVQIQKVHVLKGYGFSRAARKPLKILGYSP
jgi:hypothetical protein